MTNYYKIINRKLNYVLKNGLIVICGSVIAQESFKWASYRK